MDIPKDFTISGLAALFKHDRRKVARILREQGVECVRKQGKWQFYIAADYHAAAIADITGDDNEILDYTQERAKLAREQRQKIALEREVLRGSLIPAEDVAQMLATAGTVLRSRMSALPTKAAATVTTLNQAEAEAVLRDYVYGALEEFANSPLPGAAGGPAAAAGSDGEPVGRQVSEAQQRG